MFESFIARIGNRQAVLFVALAVILLGLLALSLIKSAIIGIGHQDLPYIAISIVELVVPSVMCILASRQFGPSGKKWLVGTAMVITAPFIMGFCVAPWVMISVGTIHSYLGGFVIFGITTAAGVVYFVLL